MGRPVVLLGCGRLGSAILEGWLKTGAVAPSDLIILTPSEKPAALEAQARGARLNPPLEALAEARALVLAVKPAMWREAAAPLAATLAADAAVVSVMAGVPAARFEEFFGARQIVRVMPTTGVAQARGAASIWSAELEAAALARGLFSPIAEVVELSDESLIDAATAVSGSGPAYLFAFTRALAQAGEKAGLPYDDAVRLARATLRSAAAGSESNATLEALIAQVASPGGTTEAGLKALNENGALDRAVEGAAMAALKRAGELSG